MAEIGCVERAITSPLRRLAILTVVVLAGVAFLPSQFWMWVMPFVFLMFTLLGALVKRRKPSE